MQKETQLQFHYGDEIIKFTCANRKGNSSKLLIKVHPNCTISVASPPAIDEATILNAVKKRSRWIYRQLCYFRQQQEHMIPREYVSGETHYYLGRQYLLKVTQSSTEPSGVKLLRGNLEVTIKRKSASEVKKHVDNWYKDRAKDIFIKQLDMMLEKALWVTERPPVRFQYMKTQWGSCSAKGQLTLNPSLVKAPKEFIDYVILHELCHIAEHNHSERFYRLMQQVIPTWEKTKKRLDGMAYLIL